MDVLVIGGSVFLGRAVVDEALGSGAAVTVFNRGRSGSVPDGVRRVTGDRTEAADLEQLRGAHFDLVVDTCGYVPRDVSIAANLLAGSCGHYAFVSSINAFPAWPQEVDYRAHGAHDGNPDASRDDVPAGMDASDSYGWLKVGCERAVERAFGADRTSVLRGGLIMGPNDSAVGRLPWWLHRVARGGEVLVPGRPDAPVAMIDARDLARFALLAVAGTFETPGPTGRDTRADLMDGCAAVTGTDASFTYVDDEEWLIAQGVAAWTELPLWGPEAQMPSTFVHHSEDSERAGLRWRPLHDSLADTWAWQQQVDGGWHPNERAPGLAADREQKLLTEWHQTERGSLRH